MQKRNFATTELTSATGRLHVTLEQAREDLEQARLLADLAKMTGEVRALAAELAETQRALLAAERPAETDRPTTNNSRRAEYRPLPARPRTDDNAARVHLAGELVELRGLVERVTDPVLQQDLSARVARFQQQVLDQSADVEAIRTDTEVVRALLFRALKPKPVTVEQPPEPVRSRRHPRSQPKPLRWVLLGLAVMVGAAVMVAIYIQQQPRPVVEAVKPKPAVLALPAVQKPVAGYVDSAGRFRCELPVGWVKEESHTAEQSRLRLTSQDDQIFVVSGGAGLPGLEQEPRDAVSGTIVQRVLQLVPGVSYSETADERWVPMGETWTVQVGLRLMFPQRAATALAVNFRQNGRDHLLVLVAQSQGNETFLQGVFQKFIYSYEALGGEPSPVSPSGSVPFLEGVVADGLSIERGRR